MSLDLLILLVELLLFNLSQKDDTIRQQITNISKLSQFVLENPILPFQDKVELLSIKILIEQLVILLLDFRNFIIQHASSSSAYIHL